MKRLTTSTGRRISWLLLLVTIVSNLGPLTLAATLAPPRHACCVRKSVHRCHDSSEEVAEPGELGIRDGSCCGHGCCRAFIGIQCAYRHPRGGAFFLETISTHLAQAQVISIASAYAEFQSTRAPPAS